MTDLMTLTLAYKKNANSALLKSKAVEKMLKEKVYTTYNEEQVLFLRKQQEMYHEIYLEQRAIAKHLIETYFPKVKF